MTSWWTLSSTGTSAVLIKISSSKRLVTEFVNYYNTKRLHSSIGYVAPVDKLLGKEEEIFRARDQKPHAARAERRQLREITPAVVEMKKHGAVTKYQIAT